MYDAQKTYYDWGQMDHMAMYRERLIRIIRELGAIEYDDVGVSMERSYNDINAVNEEWEIKKDEKRDVAKEPLVDDEEWAEIKRYDAGPLETWRRWRNLTRGSKWEYLDRVLKLDGYRAGACESAWSRIESATM